MNHAAHCLLATWLMLHLPSVIQARDVYVSRLGNDSNAGTREAPFASLQAAADAVLDSVGGTIWIEEGEYFLPAGISLDARHRGSADRPLEIRGRGLNKTRLTGARIVQDFRQITAKEAESLISEDARQQVLVANLSSQGFPPLNSLPESYKAHGCEEVVFEDRAMQSARWPNADFTSFTEVIDAGASDPVHWVTREVYRPGSFRFPGDRARRWDFSRGIWFHGFWCYDWSDEILKAGSYDADSGELRLAAKHRYGVGNPWKKDSKRRFYALHVFEELDQPGEYYLDRQNNRLYFWPPSDLAVGTVRLTLCAKPIFQGNGISRLTIRDLTIENGRGPGIQLTNCRDCTIENCCVRNTGRQGISCSGTGISILRCEVTTTASYGIRIDGGDRKTLTRGQCSVRGCHVHHVGRQDWQGGRGISVAGCGNHVANNLLHHGPTGAISYGGNEHLLELNEVHDVCIHYSDVGVFYTGRDWSSQGNVVRWNYVHDITNNAGHGSSAFYLDDCDSGDTVTGNIVFGGVGRGVLLGGGRDNTIRGNIFVDLPIGIHVDARGGRAITLDKPGSWNLLAKCEQVDYQSPLWKEHYPRLATVMNDHPLEPRGNSLRNNIMIDCQKAFALSKDVDEAWLDRQGNLQLSRDEVDLPKPLPSSSRLDPAMLTELCNKIPELPVIPIQKIGLDGLE